MNATPEMLPLPDRKPVDAAVAGSLVAAQFPQSLQRMDATGGPGPGLHNWFRGGPLKTYDGWARAALKTLDGLIRTEIAEEIWERVLRTSWEGPSVWFHGDIASGNLLVRDGALAAVIDFGTCGVGDPACDLAIAWTMLTGKSRAAFRERLDVDEPTWVRGQGWALWKALVVCAGAVRDGDDLPADARIRSRRDHRCSRAPGMTVGPAQTLCRGARARLRPSSTHSTIRL